MGRLRDRPAVPHSWFEHDARELTLPAGELFGRDVRVRYREAGTGPPLLLVHGLQTSGYSWRYVLDELARTHRVIVPDLVGCGHSDAPADFGYAPERIADFLEHFRAALPNPPAQWDVVGNSLGGVYASTYAAGFPARVRRLVIIHSPGFMKRAPFLGLELLRRGRAPLAISRLFGPWMVNRYLRYHRPDIKSREELAEFGQPLRSAEGRRAFWHIVRDGLGPERADELGPILGRITAPTMLIWARNDTLIPAEIAQPWHDAIPGSRLEWIDDSSHFTQVDQPERTAKLILEHLAGI